MLMLMSVEFFIYFPKGPVHQLDSQKRSGMKTIKYRHSKQGLSAVFELNSIKYEIRMLEHRFSCSIRNEVAVSQDFQQT